MIHPESIAALQVIRDCRSYEEAKLMLQLHGYRTDNVDVSNESLHTILWLWPHDVSYRKLECVSSIYYHLIPRLLESP